LDELDSLVPVTFEGDSRIGPTVCSGEAGSRDLTQYQKDMYSSLIYIKNTEFDSPLPWTSMPTFDWLRSVARGIRLRTDRDASFCCDPARVVNIAAVAAPEARIPIYVQSLIHEARHIERGPHRCADGQRDRTVSELGAYGCQYSLLLWIGTHAPAASPEERRYALSFAEWLRAVAFCAECG